VHSGSNADLARAKPPGDEDRVHDARFVCVRRLAIDRANPALNTQLPAQEVQSLVHPQRSVGSVMRTKDAKARDLGESTTTVA
jgi:hypothetical protein